MLDEALIQKLVLRILDSDRTPEDVCADYPELLCDVHKRLKSAKLVEACLDELFPSSTERATNGWSESLHVPGYELEQIIGRGGMGIVFRARHLKLNRMIAMKMLAAGPFASPRERARIKREAEAVAALSHPNIVQIYDVGELEWHTYFTMELLEGGNLAERLAGHPQAARESAQLVATLALAVAYAHQHGVVHRDLKPDNILLTAEGVPKIADFGLARLEGTEQDLTMSGDRLGTPSYMAPEQASGNTHDVDAQTDIYALGGILYKMLTGRPPFRADTTAETIRQVIYEELARPTRLNASVPRDLETICLKCLQKAPLRRYASANDMADDLHRFLNGQPIHARPVGLFEKTIKWGRRRPSEASLVALLIILTTLTVVGGFWLERQRSTKRESIARQEGRASQALRDAMKNAVTLQDQGSWPASLKMLSDAEQFLDDSNETQLQRDFHQACKDAAVVIELEDVRLRAGEARYNRAGPLPSVDQLYAEAFRRCGIGVLDSPVEEVSKAIERSKIREPLIAFLHDWLHDVTAINHPRISQILDIADTNEWRRSVRQALTEKDSDRLKILVRAPSASLQPPIVIAGLASALRDSVSGEELLSLFREVQKRHSEDFWIHYIVGDNLLQINPAHAVGPLSAAVGIRPRSPHAYLLLGRALRNTEDASGAITAFRMAIALDPANAAVNEMATALTTNADLQETRIVWERTLATSPPAHDRWFGYAELCLFLNNEEAYTEARRALLKRHTVDSDHWTVAERTSLTCLLRPVEADELKLILPLVHRAVATGPKFPHPDNAYIQFAEGLLQYRLGNYQQAIPLLEESSAILPNRPGPRLALAMSYFKAGHLTKARKTFSAAICAYNWQETQAKGVTAWVSHVLRREAEDTIFPDLKAVLERQRTPQDDDERFALLGACQFQGKFAFAAELYSHIFQSSPDLADKLTLECRLRGVGLQGSDRPFDVLNSECRYTAARCAALSAGGSGSDGASLNDAERALWRAKSREWLLADLAVWEKILQSGSDMDRELTKRMLTYWEVDLDLAAIRESLALEKLPREERFACHELWRKVGVLRERANQRLVVSTDDAEPRAALVEQRRLQEARLRWQLDLEANPPEPDAWNGYAELCLFLGYEDDFRRARRALLVKFGPHLEATINERIGRTSLLMPIDKDMLAGAVSLVNRATANRPAVEWTRPFYAYTEGLAAYRQKHFEEAITLIRKEASEVYGPAPGLIVAMSLKKSGRQEEATDTLASSILAYDWRRVYTRDPATWTFNVLRREAEDAIVPRLPEFLEGEWQPQNNSERLALLGVCQFEARWRDAARLYAAAFDSDPSLPQRLITAGFGRFPWQSATMDPFEVLCSSSRFGAARCATLTSCESENGYDNINEGERIAWRKQALRWLEADLKTWASLYTTGSPLERDVAKKMLTHWQTEPDLTSIREPSALSKLPTDQAVECREFWEMVKVALAGGEP